MKRGTIGQNEIGILQRTERATVKNMCGVKLMDKKSTKDPIQNMGIYVYGNFTTMADRQLYEQKIIQKFNTYKCGSSRPLGFLSNYTLFNTS